jgi:hypothetical protein
MVFAMTSNAKFLFHNAVFVIYYSGNPLIFNIVPTRSGNHLTSHLQHTDQ